MELKYSEMSVDTSLAQEYLNKKGDLLQLINEYDATTKECITVYDGETFKTNVSISMPSFFCTLKEQDDWDVIPKMASSLKQNASLIAQLEYHFRNIPIEVTSVQLNLLIQYLKCYVVKDYNILGLTFYPKSSLLMFGTLIQWEGPHKAFYCISKETAAISHLLVTLLKDAGSKYCYVQFKSTQQACPELYGISETLLVRGSDSGTLAVVSDDADIDSAVDKFLSVSKQAPWQLRRILVQESVYQQFKDALSWKCDLNKSRNKPLTADVVGSDILTYNDITFLIDPVVFTEENPSLVTIEAYRTTKEMISLVQQDKPRYLSLWTNGIAEINEVTHATKSPVVWVNNVADFRGPPQVSKAVFEYDSHLILQIMEDDRFAKLCKLSQSWLKLDLESRRDILCDVLDKFTMLYPVNTLYSEIKKYILNCIMESFVDVGKDYVCIGMSEPIGVMGFTETTIFSQESFKSILQGNALLVLSAVTEEDSSDYTLLEQAGVPVVRGQKLSIPGHEVPKWNSTSNTTTRVVWTNSGTIFAN